MCAGSLGIALVTASPVQLMELQAAALFRHDEAGRLLSINVPSRYPAPRVFIGRTMDGNVLRFRHDLPDEIVGRLTALIESEPLALSGEALEQSPGYLPAITELLAERAAAVEQVWHGPAWTFPETIGEDATSAIEVDLSNAEALSHWFPWLADELKDSWPCFAVLDDGDAVAICHSVRTTPDAVEAGVETVEAYRGRGYATLVVRAWALAVGGAGLLPLYSTSWENRASRGVARKLGLQLFGADLHIT